MNLDRRAFTRSIAGGLGFLAPSAGWLGSAAAQTPAPGPARAATRLPPTAITRIRVFYPPNYNPNGPQAFPQSNMVVLVDTEAVPGLTSWLLVYA